MDWRSRLKMLERRLPPDPEPVYPQIAWIAFADDPQLPEWAEAAIERQMVALRGAPVFIAEAYGRVLEDGAIYAQLGYDAFGGGWYLITPEGARRVDGLPAELCESWEAARRSYRESAPRAGPEYPLFVDRRAAYQVEP